MRRHLKSPALIVDAYAWLRAEPPTRSHGAVGQEVREFQRTLAEMDREEHRLLDAYQAGLIELGQLERREGLLRQRRTHVQAGLETIRGEHAAALQRADLQRSVADFARSIAPTLATLPFAERQRLVRTVIERVMVEEGQIDIHFAIPLSDPPPGTSPDSPHPPRPRPVSTDFHLRSDRDPRRRQLPPPRRRSPQGPQDPAAGVTAGGRSKIPRFYITCSATMKRLVARGGRVVPGSGVGRAGLLGRSRRLARASAGVVAFLWGAPRGSGFTVGEAIRPGKPAAVVLAGGGAELPSFPGGTWVPCSIGSVAAFRWVPGPEGEHPTRKTWLAGVFQVPEGEPTHALLTHISSLSQGDRLWFERGIVGGDTVLVPHEALSDTPALLAIPRLTRRFRCTVREASGLAELFLALDASPAVVAHYEAEARCRRIASIVDDLVHPVARLALVEQGPDTDALEDAECLGDGAEWVTEDGQVAQRGVQPEEDGAHRAWQTVAWHPWEPCSRSGSPAQFAVQSSRRTMTPLRSRRAPSAAPGTPGKPGRACGSVA